MTRIDLMMTNRTIKEYRPMNWLSRRRYSKAIDHALRYVCPPDETFKAVLETLFWLAVACATAAAVLAVPVLFVRWWMCL